MGKPREFTTVPARAIADKELTRRDLLALMVVSFHDGMSGKSGKGGGCFARFDNMARMARMDTGALSRSISKLVKLGYLSREPQQMDKRRWTFRVIFGGDDGWMPDTDLVGAHDNQLVGAHDNHPRKVVVETTGASKNVVVVGGSENGGFSRENGDHYTSLSEELDFDESNKLEGTSKNSCSS